MGQKGIYCKFCIISILSCFLAFPIEINGHISSIYTQGDDVLLGGYIFRAYPKQGQVKPPFVQHQRQSRGPLLHSQDSMDIGHLSYLRPPSFTHKYLTRNRLSKFHQGTAFYPTNSQFPNDNDQSSTSTENELLEKLFSNLSSDNEEKGINSSESPTFTPYISAKALSNMEQFFQHLRENLEALQNDENMDGIEGNDGKNGRKHKISIGSAAEWKPMASGLFGLKKIRSFFPSSQATENRQSRLGTNLGLGKK